MFVKMALHWLRVDAILFCLILFSGISSSAPAEPLGFLEDEFITPNATAGLQDRSIDRREIFSRCGNSGLSPLLAQTIQDARDIMTNMVDHLDLAIRLYRSDGSGELRQEKLTSGQRTFDEHNAFANYRQFISNHYTGVNAAGNREGYEALLGTRKLAKTITDQLEKYLNGKPVRWLRGGFPYINIYCNDNKVLSKTSSEGYTYTEATGNPNPVRLQSGDPLYWVMQKAATQAGKETWVLRKGVCDADPDNLDYDPDGGSSSGSSGAAMTRFGVPVEKLLDAYTYKALFGSVEEIIVLCPSHHAKWLRVDADRSRAGKHYRDLHVDVGKEPTDAQRAAARVLLADPDFHGKFGRGIKWLGDFLVQVLIHESTHAEAFTGGGNALVDVECLLPRSSEDPILVIKRTTSVDCMRAVVRGDQGRVDGKMQGHMDAEGFSMYAMACWVNVVSWHRGYSPRERVNP